MQHSHVPVYIRPVYYYQEPPPTNQLFAPPSVGVFVSKTAKPSHDVNSIHHRRRQQVQIPPGRGGRSYSGRALTFDGGHGSRRDLVPVYENGRHHAATGSNSASIGNTSSAQGPGAAAHGGGGGLCISGSGSASAASTAAFATGLGQHMARYREVAPRATPRTHAPQSLPVPRMSSRREIDGRAYGAYAGELRRLHAGSDDANSAVPEALDAITETSDAVAEAPHVNTNAPRSSCEGGVGSRSGADSRSRVAIRSRTVDPHVEPRRWEGVSDGERSVDRLVPLARGAGGPPSSVDARETSHRRPASAGNPAARIWNGPFGGPFRYGEPDVEADEQEPGAQWHRMARIHVKKP